VRARGLWSATGRTSDRSGWTMRSNGQKLGPLRENAASGRLLLVAQQRRRLDRRSGNLHHSVTCCWAGQRACPRAPQGCSDSRQSMMVLVRWVRRLQFPSPVDAGAIRSRPAMIAAPWPMQQAPHGQSSLRRASAVISSRVFQREPESGRRPCLKRTFSRCCVAGCAAQTTQARSAVSEEERGRHSTPRTADGRC
jgi:hypothetical protein